MDTKLTADVAESAVTTELLKRRFRVLKPFGDRLPYDLALDVDGRMIRIQVKAAWFNPVARCYVADTRRTKTNRRRMVRQRYSPADFDFAILYIADLDVFYVMPVSVFSSFGSTISLVEGGKRQRKPRSAEYRERWDLLPRERDAQNLAINTPPLLPFKCGVEQPGSSQGSKKVDPGVEANPLGPLLPKG